MTNLRIYRICLISFLNSTNSLPGKLPNRTEEISPYPLPAAIHLRARPEPIKSRQLLPTICRPVHICSAREPARERANYARPSKWQNGACLFVLPAVCVCVLPPGRQPMSHGVAGREGGTGNKDLPANPFFMIRVTRRYKVRFEMHLRFTMNRVASNNLSPAILSLAFCSTVAAELRRCLRPH